MGMLNKIVSVEGLVSAVASAVKDTSEIFHENETEALRLSAQQYQSSLGQFAAEFSQTQTGWFSRFVNALNRLPRPLMALGTIGLFVLAMMNPEEFAARMHGLSYIPEPLWWLMGAIVSFYFGARELHHFRAKSILGAGIGTDIVQPFALNEMREIQKDAFSRALTKALEGAGEFENGHDAQQGDRARENGSGGGHDFQGNAAVLEWQAQED